MRHQDKFKGSAPHMNQVIHKIRELRSTGLPDYMGQNRH
jgi:hypothetical protein